jgi:hypothetical protein
MPVILIYKRSIKYPFGRCDSLVNVSMETLAEILRSDIPIRKPLIPNLATLVRTTRSLTVPVVTLERFMVTFYEAKTFGQSCSEDRNCWAAFDMKSNG